MATESVGAGEADEAQVALINRIAELARTLAVQFGRRTDPDDLDDIVQEVLIECWARIEAGNWAIKDSDLPTYVNWICSRRSARSSRMRGIRSGTRPSERS